MTAAAVPAFGTPGLLVYRVLDAAAMDRDVARMLVDEHGVAGLSSVSCPRGIAVVADTRAECTAIVEGTAVQVPIRVLGDEGDYEIGPPAT